MAWAININAKNKELAIKKFKQRQRKDTYITGVCTIKKATPKSFGEYQITGIDKDVLKLHPGYTLAKIRKKETQFNKEYRRDKNKHK